MKKGRFGDRPPKPVGTLYRAWEKGHKCKSTTDRMVFKPPVLGTRGGTDGCRTAEQWGTWTVPRLFIGAYLNAALPETLSFSWKSTLAG